MQMGWKGKTNSVHVCESDPPFSPVSAKRDFHGRKPETFKSLAITYDTTVFLHFHSKLAIKSQSNLAQHHNYSPIETCLCSQHQQALLCQKWFALMNHSPVCNPVKNIDGREVLIFYCVPDRTFHSDTGGRSSTLAEVETL